MSSSANISFVLHDVARLLRKRFEQRSRMSGLTRAQWQVLAYLSLHEGIHQNKLADLIEIMPITLARLLDKMEARGFIERRPDPADRRAWLLYLTPQAHPLLEDHAQPMARKHETRPSSAFRPMPSSTCCKP